MKAKSKPEYNDKMTLWAVVPALVLCGLTSLVFCLSPLGLGFDNQATNKFNSDFIFDLFQLIFWAGPISILIGVVLIVGGIIRPSAKVSIRRIMWVLVIAIIIAQISMLIYLVS